MLQLNDDAIGPLQVGQKATCSKTVSEGDVALFAQVSGDTALLHTDEAYAAQTRFGGRIAHGMLTTGFISATLGTKRIGPEYTVLYLDQHVRFLAPVKIGDTVEVRVEATSVDSNKRIVRLKTECYNQRGEPVATGEATVLLDSHPFPR